MPVKSVPEVIALAKQSPGKLNAPTGLGSNIHMATLQMQQRAGVKWTYIPTKGGQSSVMSVMTNSVGAGPSMKSISGLDKLTNVSLRMSSR